MINSHNSKDRQRIADKFARLIEIMAVLRSPGGCEWDIAQDHKTLRPYMIEESYEALEALDNGDMTGFTEELGDVLLQIVFHSRMAEESKTFSIEEVIDGITGKMIRRHPHVFGNEKAPTPQAALSSWHKMKSEEKIHNGKAGTLTDILKDIPRSFPSLMRAQRFGEKVAPYGFDWRKPEDVFEKIDEELQELKDAYKSGVTKDIQEELGDVLFVLAQFSRKLEIDAEQSLSDAVQKFLGRFDKMERLAKAKYNSNHLELEQWDELWNEAKKG